MKTGVNRIDSSFPESIPALPESIPEIQNRFQNAQFVILRFCEESNRFQLPGIDSSKNRIDSRALGIDSKSHRIGYLSPNPQNLITFHNQIPKILIFSQNPSPSTSNFIKSIITHYSQITIFCSPHHYLRF